MASKLIAVFIVASIAIASGHFAHEHHDNGHHAKHLTVAKKPAVHHVSRPSHHEKHHPAAVHQGAAPVSKPIPTDPALATLPIVAPVQPKMTSAELESHFNPVVHGLPDGQSKLVYQGADGKEQCLVCQPFQGCGCSDIVGIRCEMKRLRKKLHRLKSLADPLHAADVQDSEDSDE